MTLMQSPANNNLPIKKRTPLSRTQIISRCALLAALALALAALETLFPVPIPVPGIRLGLANIITVIAAYWLGPAYAAVVLLVRIILAAIVTGQLSTLAFSLAGGLCALIVITVFVRFFAVSNIRLCSMVAAVVHNFAQIMVALFLTSTPEILLYLPILMIAGLFTGFITGTIAQLIVNSPALKIQST